MSILVWPPLALILPSPFASPPSFFVSYFLVFTDFLCRRDQTTNTPQSVIVLNTIAFNMDSSSLTAEVVKGAKGGEEVEGGKEGMTRATLFQI